MPSLQNEVTKYGAKLTALAHRRTYAHSPARANFDCKQCIASPPEQVLTPIRDPGSRMHPLRASPLATRKENRESSAAPLQIKKPKSMCSCRLRKIRCAALCCTCNRSTSVSQHFVKNVLTKKETDNRVEICCPSDFIVFYVHRTRDIVSLLDRAASSVCCAPRMREPFQCTARDDGSVSERLCAIQSPSLYTCVRACVCAIVRAYSTSEYIEHGHIERDRTDGWMDGWMGGLHKC